MNEITAYALIITAALLCSCQFLFQRAYNKTEGSGIYAAMLFAFLGSIIKIVSAFATYGFEHTFTLGSAILALLSALDNVMVMLFSAKVFKIANMSVYSLFMMLGGMALPFAYGMMIGESFTLGKILCFALILVAMLITTDFKTKGSRAAIKYYIGIFVGNGLFGVLATANQNLENHSSSGTFLLMTGVWTLAVCGASVLVTALKTKRKLFVAPKSALISSALYGVISTFSSLFILIALETLDASVQYPLITGGTIVFSAIICLIRREKLTARDFIAAAVAAGASVVVIL